MNIWLLGLACLILLIKAECLPDSGDDLKSVSNVGDNPVELSPLGQAPLVGTTSPVASARVCLELCHCPAILLHQPPPWALMEAPPHLQTWKWSQGCDTPSCHVLWRPLSLHHSATCSPLGTLPSWTTEAGGPFCRGRCLQLFDTRRLRLLPAVGNIPPRRQSC